MILLHVNNESINPTCLHKIKPVYSLSPAYPSSYLHDESKQIVLDMEGLHTQKGMPTAKPEMKSSRVHPFSLHHALTVQK